ncbi:MAG: 4Fe-4S dicluster domain-containing protein [candidate division WOR-3 bacterium]
MRFNNEEKASPLYCSSLLPATHTPADALPPSMIPCLGSISNAFILAWVLQEEKPLEIFTGTCDECPTRAGEKQFREREKEIQSLFDFLRIGFPPVSISVGSALEKGIVARQYDTFRTDIKQSKTLSRRDFFRHVRHSVMTHGPQSERNGAHKEDVEPIQRGPGTERRFLVELFRKYAGRRDGEKGVVPLYREVQADERCVGCGACANLCPTGALSLDEGPTEVHLQWRPAHCSSCDLCLDACVRKALHATTCTEARRITDQTTATIRVFQRLYCPACGDTFLSCDPDARCSECSKTERFMDAVSVMIYGVERTVP